MAKVTDQPELTAAPAATDMFLVSEISSGLSKKINFNRMISGYRNFTTGAWTLPAPSSGKTLALTGITGNAVFETTDGTSVFQVQNTATQAFVGMSSNHQLALMTNNTARIACSNTGNVTINAPSSGKAVAADGEVTVASGTATPAGGTAGKGLTFGTTTNLGVFFGSGVPTLSAAQGSLYLRTDGSSTSTRLYVNTNGTTGWTNVTTAT